jgi:hypothetical protein
MKTFCDSNACWCCSLWWNCGTKALSGKRSWPVSRTVLLWTNHAVRCFLIDFPINNVSLYTDWLWKCLSGLLIVWLSCDWMTIDEVWIVNRIYLTVKQLLSTNNYDSLTELHTPKITVTTAHIKSSQFTSRCFVAASNCGRYPSSGFPNCLRLQLTASHFSYLHLWTDSTNTQSQSQSQNYFTTGRLPPISSSVTGYPELFHDFLQSLERMSW